MKLSQLFSVSDISASRDVHVSLLVHIQSILSDSTWIVLQDTFISDEERIPPISFNRIIVMNSTIS